MEQRRGLIKWSCSSRACVSGWELSALAGRPLLLRVALALLMMRSGGSDSRGGVDLAQGWNNGGARAAEVAMWWVATDAERGRPRAGVAGARGELLLGGGGASCLQGGAAAQVLARGERGGRQRGGRVRRRRGGPGVVTGESDVGSPDEHARTERKMGSKLLRFESDRKNWPAKI
jgi:hypothetical protein